MSKKQSKDKGKKGFGSKVVKGLGLAFAGVTATTAIGVAKQKMDGKEMVVNTEDGFSLTFKDKIQEKDAVQAGVNADVETSKVDEHAAYNQSVGDMFSFNVREEKPAEDLSVPSADSTTERELPQIDEAPEADTVTQFN